MDCLGTMPKFASQHLEPIMFSGSYNYFKYVWNYSQQMTGSQKAWLRHWCPGEASWLLDIHMVLAGCVTKVVEHWLFTCMTIEWPKNASTWARVCVDFKCWRETSLSLSQAWRWFRGVMQIFQSFDFWSRTRKAMSSHVSSLGFLLHCTFGSYATCPCPALPLRLSNVAKPQAAFLCRACQVRWVKMSSQGKWCSCCPSGPTHRCPSQRPRLPDR